MVGGGRVGGWVGPKDDCLLASLRLDLFCNTTSTLSLYCAQRTLKKKKRGGHTNPDVRTIIIIIIIIYEKYQMYHPCEARFVRPI